MVWVLKHAQVPRSEPIARLVLIGLANHAADDGTGARPSVATLAEYAGCSVRSVHNKLDVLREVGLIRRGDQRAVGHLRADRRPVVWDLNMQGEQDFADVLVDDSNADNNGVHVVHPVETARTSVSYGVHVVHPVDGSVDNSAHGMHAGAHRTPDDMHQCAPREGGHGMHTGADRTVLKNKYLNNNNNASADAALAADAADVGDEVHQPHRAPVAAPPGSPRPSHLDEAPAVLRQLRATLPPALSRQLAPNPVLSRLRALLAQGWVPDQILDRFTGQSWAGVGPGLIVSTLAGMLEEGPPPVLRASTVPTPERCQDHGIQGASTCSPCWSEVKTGDRQQRDVGRNLSSALLSKDHTGQ